MTGLETAIVSIAKPSAIKFVTGRIAKIFEPKGTPYTNELYEIVNQTIEEYSKSFGVEETDKIPFYKSITLLDLLLEFRFTKKLDEGEVKKTLEADNRIIVPSSEEVGKFLLLLNEKIERSQHLKQLNIDYNYKEEIFNISAFLTSLVNTLGKALTDIKNEIAVFKVSQQLTDEWNIQLDEIGSNLKVFKAKTAKERLLNLELRIREQGISSPSLFAKLYSLLAEAVGLSQNITDDIEEDTQAKLHIKMFKLVPTNLLYIANAAVAYVYMGEPEKAKELATNILAEDEFNLAGWLTLVFAADEDYQSILPQIPKAVRKKDDFKLNLFRWLASKRREREFPALTSLDIENVIHTPDVIVVNYQNLHYNHLASQFLLSKYYYEHTSLPLRLIFPSADENKELIDCFRILHECSKKLANTEIAGYYLDYEFEYRMLRYVFNQERQDILEMEKIFNAIPKKQEQVVAAMMQGYNTLDMPDYTEKSIAIAKAFIAESGPSEIVQIMMAGTAMAMGNTTQQVAAFIDYIGMQKTIHSNVFFNFLNFLRNKGLVGITQEQKSIINDWVEKSPTGKEVYRLLLKIFSFLNLQIGDYQAHELQTLIDNAKAESTGETEDVKKHIAYAYVLTDEVQKSKEFIESYLDYNKLSESYALYCKIKFNIDEEKVSLLALLKKHREEFPIDIILLQIELNLVHLQGKIKDAIKIARKGVELFPWSEYFVRNFFILLNADVQIEEIKKSAPIVINFDFKEEENVVAVSQILLRAEMFEDVRNLLYRYATNQANTLSRQAYFFHSSRFPKALFNEFDTVETGSFVKYEINRTKKIIEITELNKNSHPYRLFIGKKTGETFSYQKKFGATVELGKIIRIMDKYLALFEEIMEEANDPLSALPMQQITFASDDPEELKQAMISAFGITGSLEQEWRDKLLNKYYSGSTSFGELVRPVFKGQLIDAYFVLTNNNGKPFKAISRAAGISLFPENAVFVLDGTGLSLFYLLAKEQGIHFNHKFLISPFLRQLVEAELEETKKQEYGISISVTMNGVVPHLYDDGFKNRRIETFQGLLNWIDANCIQADIPERLAFATKLDQEIQNDFSFNVLLDCRLLIDRSNHFLLTNDYLILRSLKANSKLAISPVCYLETFASDKQKSYTAHMLEKNYVGIPITAENLGDEFFKMVADKDNRFTICLENLKFAWNPETRHINEAIIFIKNLYVSSYVNDISRDQTTLAVLRSLINGMDKRLINIVGIVITREFRLLGHHLSHVLGIFSQIIAQ